ncbi:CD209 antigen-like protein C [Polypterus senegalus]|uniref:CD209 antigen-like protein C n=1 Tax=Polypterus senegalus TaxID=55291 RepID=UPI001965AF10|nr:CD209 antigen-like protein C [Polypterus senegalus]
MSADIHYATVNFSQKKPNKEVLRIQEGDTTTYAEVKVSGSSDSPSSIDEPVTDKIIGEQAPGALQRRVVKLRWVFIILALLCLVLVITFSLHFNTRNTCPQLWRPFKSKCYFFSTVEMNWSLSQENCTAMGGHLVIIESEDEQEFLLQEANITQYWIGLTDSEEEGAWHWVDKSTLRDPKFWGERNGKKEPDNHNGNEDCARLNTDQGLKGWFDVSCGRNSKWACEAQVKNIKL